MSTMSMAMRGPPQPPQQQQPPNPNSPTSHKRSRPPDLHDPLNQPPADDPFHHEDGDDGDDDDDDDGDRPKVKNDKKAGRRKIKIEFIQDKSRRHITFSKRKAGIMKKAYELSTLTGTQVLLLVVSETGLVYTFTTAKLQPLVTQPEGKNLIQACLNAPNNAPPGSTVPGANPPTNTSTRRSGGSNNNSQVPPQQQQPPSIPPTTVPIPPTNSAPPSSASQQQQPPPDPNEEDKSPSDPSSPPSKRTRRSLRGQSPSSSQQQQSSTQQQQQQQQQASQQQQQPQTSPTQSHQPYHPHELYGTPVIGHHPGLIPGYHIPPPGAGAGQQSYGQNSGQWGAYGGAGTGAAAAGAGTGTQRR